MNDGVPYPAIAVANYFIALAKKTGDLTLTPMKLQKLIYYAHGWHLSLTGNPLIQERVEAWKFGPVVSSIYHEFKSKGDEPITELAQVFEFGPDNDVLAGKFTTPIVHDDANVEGFLNTIWEVYGKYSGIQLSNATHADNSPWTETWEKTGKFRPGSAIPDELIKLYFDKQKK